MERKRQCQGLRAKAGKSDPPDMETRRVTEAMFQKVFHYENPSEQPWSLPEVASMFTRPRWTDEELDKMKVELNDVKSRLSCLDLTEWHQHTQNTNGAGRVIQRVRHAVQPELCTQAWCKFGDILAAFRIVPAGERGAFHSVHLCEAPGAFVTCLNHYLKNSGHIGEWEWTANTLNPYYEGNDLSEMIHDDRFIFKTMDQWCFGADNTGNIMEKQNIRDLINKVQGTRAQLVTADGSVDCVDNPAEQESLVSQLHHSEVVAALHLLSPGGTLVLKMFTLYEDSSLCLLYLLLCLFKNVSVFKPACSKAGNSEVYVVSRGFHGAEDELLDLLTQNCVGTERPDNVMFCKDQLPESFLAQHRACCHQFKEYQVSTIQSNLQLFKRSSTEDWARVHAVQECCAAMYIERLGLKPIDPSLKICQGLHMGHRTSNLSRVQPFMSKHGKQRTQGSFLQRQWWRQLPWQQMLVYMQPYDVTDFCCVHVMKGECAVEPSAVTSWVPVYGKPIRHIRSSPFCDADLLVQYNDFLKNRTTPIVNTMELSMFTVPFERILSVMRETEQAPSVRCVYTDSLSVQPSPGPFAQFCTQAGLPEHANEEGGRGPCVHCIEGQQNQEPATEEATRHKESWLNGVLDTLKKMKPGDHLVCTSSPLLSRVTAGLVFLLYCCFKQISLFGAEGGSSEQLYVVALSHTGNCEHLMNYVSSLQEDVDSPQQLLQFVPVQVLHEPDFHHCLRTFNNEWLQKRMNCLLRQEQQTLKPK